MRTSNAINGMIYEKILRFSLIRSVEHNSGSLVNHIQVDSGRMDWAAWYLSNVINLPVILGVGIYLMYVAVGISFLSGMGVLALMSGINILWSKLYFRYLFYGVYLIIFVKSNKGSDGEERWKNGRNYWNIEWNQIYQDVWLGKCFLTKSIYFDMEQL